MHAGAALGWARDRADNHAALRAAISAACGFLAAGPDGAWTWQLQQAELEGEVHRVEGTVVAACELFGLPLVRPLPPIHFEQQSPLCIGNWSSENMAVNIHLHSTA